jgi:hypothetical protein
MAPSVPSMVGPELVGLAARVRVAHGGGAVAALPSAWTMAS